MKPSKWIRLRHGIHNKELYEQIRKPRQRSSNLIKFRNLSKKKENNIHHSISITFAKNKQNTHLGISLPAWRNIASDNIEFTILYVYMREKLSRCIKRKISILLL